ncbi:MAG: helix-turn-helix domain-containing protein [Bacteroidota bacterium]
MKNANLPYLPEDKLLLNEFKKVIRKHVKKAVLNLDDLFPHKFDLQIQRVENVIQTVGNAIPTNKWSYYRICLLTNGSVEFITGMHKFNAEKNTLIIWPPRIVTSSKNWESDTTGYVLLFNLDFFLKNNFPHKNIKDKVMLSAALEPHIRISQAQADGMIDIFEAILGESKIPNSNSFEFIALKVFELLLLNERIFNSRQTPQTNIPVTDIARKFENLLEVNYLKESTVSFYASELNVHPNHLNAIVKKSSGLTAKVFIQNRLLLEAKYLLLSTSLSIKEISNELGFTNPDYFTTFFNKFEKTSPTLYRTTFI